MGAFAATDEILTPDLMLTETDSWEVKQIATDLSALDALGY